jgi:hypothetical protein
MAADRTGFWPTRTSKSRSLPDYDYSDPFLPKFPRVLNAFFGHSGFSKSIGTALACDGDHGFSLRFFRAIIVGLRIFCLARLGDEGT